MKTLTFKPINEGLLVRTESRLLDALLAKKLNVLMACGGNGLCATCHVFVKEGMERLSPRTERERRTLSFVSGTDATSRLSCQCRVRGDGVVVELPPGLFIERAEDLLGLLGTRAPADVLHPLSGKVLIQQGKIITRTQIEALRSLNIEVCQVRPPDTSSCSSVAAPAPPRPVAPIPFAAPKPPTTWRLGNPETSGPRESATGIGEATVSGDTTPGSTRPARPSTDSTTNQPAAFQVGSTVGKCLLIELLGQGGSGVVYRALHKSLNIQVAVKVLQIEASENDREVYRRLQGEAQILAQLNHPNIVRVWDFEEDGPLPYLVLEHVDGLSLAELIDQSGRLTLDRALSILLQMTAALEAAWQLGIVHRDVKPGNILLAKDGTAKLADLGLALVVGEAERSAEVESGEPAEHMEGTVAYMAPEQCRPGAAVDHRSDIYALGATFYHTVTGRLPFRGRGRREVMLKHLQEMPISPEQLLPELAPVAPLILRMMAKRPVDRYATYAELRADLLDLESQLDRDGASASARQSTVADMQSTDDDGAARPFWKLLLSSFGRKRAARKEG